MNKLSLLGLLLLPCLSVAALNPKTWQPEKTQPPGVTITNQGTRGNIKVVLITQQCRTNNSCALSQSIPFQKSAYLAAPQQGYAVWLITSQRIAGREHSSTLPCQIGTYLQPQQSYHVMLTAKSVNNVKQLRCEIRPLK